MTSGIHRQRLACVECTRRKVKCDKILPCRNCTRKGALCTRPRERDSPNPSVAPSEPRSPHSISARPSADASQLIDILQSRVVQLESALKEATDAAVRSRVARPEVRVNGSSFSPAESASPAQSSFSVRTPIQADTDHTPKEVEDAATILEFLAWGRRKDPTYQDEVVRHNNIDHSPGDIPVDDDWDEAPMSVVSSASLCQALLPVKQKVYQLVKYHCECLLWYHGAFHAETLMNELSQFYDKGGGRIEGSGVHLQWIALLFAVLTGSMACAPRSVAQSWGFRGREQDILSRRWLKTAIACLHRADFMACHSIYSVTAIATLTISAHMLGHSNGFSVLLASAVRIAQGLGLHQLGSESDAQPLGAVSRELGRRIWCQLCIQDWFSIPFTESYLIHRLGFTTEKPQNCDNEIVALPEDDPSVTSYSRLFYEIAALMPDLQDDITSCNTLYTRYEEVLKYDRRLRTLATQHLPYYLQNVPIDPAWPCYVPWARRSLAISSAHKVIMIHRKFLSLSFVNPMFEFTRRTCVAASRTIIKEQKEATRDGGPLLWIHQAFSVTASIILCLDMFHQPPADDQSSEHRQLIEDGIDILSHCETDMIAQRGVSLLRAMLDTGPPYASNTRLAPDFQGPRTLHGSAVRESSLDIAAIIRTFYQQDRASASGKSQPGYPVSGAARSTYGGWSGMPGFDAAAMSGVQLVPPLGSDYAEGLDDILSLATNYLG